MPSDENRKPSSTELDSRLRPAPVLLRERLDAASLGEESIGQVINTEAKDGSFADEGFLIDSFFDVFTELSMDEGSTFVPDLHESSRLTLVPEPSAVILLVMATAVVGSRSRS